MCQGVCQGLCQELCQGVCQGVCQDVDTVTLTWQQTARQRPKITTIVVIFPYGPGLVNAPIHNTQYSRESYRKPLKTLKIQ